MNFEGKKSPVAVVSMSGVFPGANGIETFWDNITAKVNAVRDVSRERWHGNLKWLYDTGRGSDKAYSKKACIIDDFSFDATQFKLPEKLIASLDDLFFWLLFAVDDALKRCNTKDTETIRTGAILAAIALPTSSATILSQDSFSQSIRQSYIPKVDKDPSIEAPSAGRIVGFPAALVSHVFGFGGTAYTLDAACASSLYALKLACDELQSCRADMMITGGVSGADSLYTQIGFSQLRALSPSGRCAPFDQSADGLVVGEGAGILVLKRLEDAIRHGDTIYGVIRGIGLSNDMRGNLLAPESDGQLRAMRMAYEQAGWRPGDVDYIECHGAGTPVGDATELQSLRMLWENETCEPGRCAIGSVKSMIGHLLTAAGAAGMIKTLLGLHHKTLPPSLNFENALADSPLQNSPFRVQTEPQTWQLNNEKTPRRAAVSAFGFGGINGHVLFEEWTDTGEGGKTGPSMVSGKAPCPAEDETTDCDIAIVGMDVHLGNLKGLVAFQEAVFNGRSALGPLPPGRWKCPDARHPLWCMRISKGGFLSSLDIDVGEFRIPPGELPDILPQQLLMLKVAAGAMRNAGMPLDQARERMGAIIGIAFDYEATNFNLRWRLPQMAQHWKEAHLFETDEAGMDQWLEKARDGCGPPLTATRTLGALGGIVASRVAREFRFGGPSFVVSAEEASGLEALAVAMNLLRSGHTDAMLVGAVDLACDERNLFTQFRQQQISPSGEVRPFDQKADGTLPGEGAVAMVIKRADDAVRDRDRIYAVIKGMGWAHGAASSEDLHPNARTYKRSLDLALSNARVKRDAIGLFETHGCGIPEVDDCEADALGAFFEAQPGHSIPSIALGALKPVVGHTGVVSGLASLAKSALSLKHNLLPPMTGYTAPRSSIWLRSRFHMPQDPAYWPWNRTDGQRVACVAAMTMDGTCMHAVLAQQASAEPATQMEAARPLGALPFALFIIGGENRSDLLENLKQLDALCADKSKAAAQDRQDSIEAIGQTWFSRPIRSISNSRQLAIVADSISALRSYLTEAVQAVQQDETRTMGVRGGIAYLAGRKAAKGKIAFVFPGSGNHYVGMGRTLGACWPEVLRGMDAGTEQLRTQMLPHLYDPWRTSWQQGWQQESYEALVADPLYPIFGQVIFGGQMARLLKLFQINPNAVIGYSLGESAGLFALNLWPDHGQMLSRLADSELFKTQLAGPCLALRHAWQIPDGQPVQWQVAVVNRNASVVDEAVADLPYVRRLIVNTPNECVIGGQEDQIRKAVKKLGCEALYLDGVVTVHCDAAEPSAQAYKELHQFQTTPIEGLQVYSCFRSAVYELSSEAAAESILGQALHGFNFPRTIEQAYEDGIRIFVEAGPQSSCTRMIRQILHDRPHVAVAANVRGEHECLSLLKCLGTLAAVDVPVDLTPLYGYQPEALSTRKAETPAPIRIPVGGKPYDLPPIPQKKDDVVIPAEPPSPAAPSAFDNNQGVADLNREPVAPSIPVTENSSAMNGIIFNALNDNVADMAKAHDQYLDLSRELTRQFGEAFQLQNQLLAAAANQGVALTRPATTTADGTQKTGVPTQIPSPAPAFPREACMEFAVGSVGKVLGPQFDIIDTYKARVRLPDEPLMLVDRIMTVEGEKCSLGPGRVVTEHDVLPDAWYLDGGRAPVCIAVEAGQADLFLSGYLGIDHQVKGERTYRLLDAKIHFHRGLPVPGETIRYDIHIDKFVKQGATYLFFFRFEGFIGDQHLITMTDGCAGFFTEDEVRNSGGIILTDDDLKTDATLNGTPFIPLVPLADASYDDRQVQALRIGDVATCFGDAFKGIHLPSSLCLPDGRMRLIDRIETIQPSGGRWGLGYIKAEADIHPDDWFLTCHFVDDKVMPGTLMYQCCAHALRVLLMRLGWVTDKQDVCYEPVQGLPCRLKCRGPVTPDTRHVHYVVEIKEVGYCPEPYVIADAHMYADGQYIVFFKDMSMQMTGLTGADVHRFWEAHAAGRPGVAVMPLAARTPGAKQVPLFTQEQILAFAIGRPSEGFGEPYRVFDEKRRIARLPGPPYCFMDRVVAIEPSPWVLKADGWIEAEYDMPENAWYFHADRSGVMPFCVLLEIALQPCGWLAAYAGSALRSEKDLKFRNLGGQGEMHTNIMPANRTLTMRTRVTKVSEAADMIIENFDFEVLAENTEIYTGTTYFGFFTETALAEQKGLRQAAFTPDDADLACTINVPFENKSPVTPDDAPAGRCGLPGRLMMPGKALRMIDGIEIFNPTGGPKGLGFIRGCKRVVPSEWFFKAHFYQDPVCPGSLGVESFLQLIKYAAISRWPAFAESHRFEMLCERAHQWEYRGQVIPSNKTVRVDAVITHVEEGDEPLILADGWLQVDGLFIYKMSNFGLKVVPK